MRHFISIWQIENQSILRQKYDKRKMASMPKLFHFTNVISASTMYFDMRKTGKKSKYKLLMVNFNLILKWSGVRGKIVLIVLSR